MSATPASANSFLDETMSDVAQPMVRRLDAKDLVEVIAGTIDLEQDKVETQLSTISKTSRLTYFSDGSVVRAPSPITVRAWKAMPTSVGKTFEWDGIVVAVSSDNFQARLRNVKGTEADFVEITEFDIVDVPVGDRDLLKPGGIFRWVVGLESRSGTRLKYSKIVFRRLPAWTLSSLESATQKLNEIVSAIRWAEDEHTSSR